MTIFEISFRDPRPVVREDAVGRVGDVGDVASSGAETDEGASIAWDDNSCGCGESGPGPDPDAMGGSEGTDGGCWGVYA